MTQQASPSSGSDSTVIRPGSHRERAILALERRQPDYVPTFELVFHETERDFEGRTFYGQPGGPPPHSAPYKKTVLHNARLYVDIARRYEHSIIFVATVVPHKTGGYPRAVIDTMRAIREIAGDEYLIMAHGDATFSIPDGNGFLAFVDRIAEDYDGLKAEAEQRLRRTLRDCRKMLKAGLDGFILCADYAFNSGPFISPGMFSDLVTPYLRREIEELRGLGAYVIKHTDGNIVPILDQLVDCRPHALHSIDPMAGVDIRKVKEEHGDRVALCGNVHCAAMQTGTEEEIRASAEYCLTWAKPGGGYIFCTSNCVFRGMPLASYDLIQDIWRRRRAYAEPG